MFPECFLGNVSSFSFWLQNTIQVLPGQSLPSGTSHLSQEPPLPRSFSGGRAWGLRPGRWLAFAPGCRGSTAPQGQQGQCVQMAGSRAPGPAPVHQAEPVLLCLTGVLSTTVAHTGDGGKGLVL